MIIAWNNTHISMMILRCNHAPSTPAIEKGQQKKSKNKSERWRYQKRRRRKCTERCAQQLSICVDFLHETTLRSSHHLSWDFSLLSFTFLPISEFFFIFCFSAFGSFKFASFFSLCHSLSLTDHLCIKKFLRLEITNSQQAMLGELTRN